MNRPPVPQDCSPQNPSSLRLFLENSSDIQLDPSEPPQG